MQKAYKIFVSVSNDLSSDQRVHKVCSTLCKDGHAVSLIGRKLKTSPQLLTRNYTTFRLHLLFNKGPLFYFFLNFQLFFKLLFKQIDILWSNDLDTLPANYLVSKIRNIPLVYDSHEYFTEVPELINRPKIKGIWEKIEKLILPQLKYAITVSDSIAKAYYNKYGIEMVLVRNFPYLMDYHSNHKADNIFIIYQGALNLGRGIEDMIRAMNYLPNVSLKIAGTGDIENELKELAQQLNLESRVKFLGRLSFTDLKDLTAKASLGLSLEEDLGLNYRFALPNKVFDYIHSGVPVLYSPLPEISKLLSQYVLGEALESREPERLAAQIDRMLHSDQRAIWKTECERAAKEFNWQNEEIKVLEIIRDIHD